MPVPADYDGDNKTDPAVYVQATGMWYALKSSTNFATSLTLSWGGLAYTPVPGGDYDGDGKADGALYYVPNSTWYVLLSGASYTTSLSKTLGGADKALVPGDYDGDGKTDFVVYNTTTGQWSGYKSESNYTTTINVSWGGTGYAPVPSDFDGDGRIDIGVYRAANTTWSVLKSSSNYGATLGAVFGTASDSPVAPFPLLIGADHATGIDSPAPNSSTNQPFTITGWALDYPATSGTGVDAIQVLAYPNPGSGEPPITITNVITGLQRSDVAAAYGTSYQNSGFVANISRLQARAYRFVVLTHASSTNTWYTGRSVTINVGSEPYLGLSYPIPQHVTQPFTVSGWALDAAAAPPGTGVNQVKLQAYPNPGSGQPPIEHDATYGLSQPAAPSFFGQQFANSGFSYTFNTLPPGTYLIFVSAHSTVSNSFSVSDSFTVDVDTPVAPLTVSHVSDEYNAPITVSLSTATAGAAISYTLNGGALTPYTGSFTVSQPSALTASASLTGYVPATASRQYSFKVATPTLSQAPGTYPGTITLTIEQTTTPDATIYWTYNGSDPDPLTGAHEYSGAITIQPGTSKTIKARAIRTGWTPSEIVGGVYTADYSGPITISAQVSPRPNAAGWNNTNVTVSFTCVNATVCPSPIVISHDTAAEIVTGTATNFDHSATSPPITLRIDRTPPQLTLTSPGGSTTTNLTSVAVAGTTTDTLSGVASIWCNGSPSSVTGSPLCNVQLAAGPNSVTLSVMDAAGNSATAGARVTRTGTASQLRILPGVRTMLPAEQRRLAGRDEYGQIVPNVSWTSSDSAVGTVDANGVITAVAVGTATITASLGSLTAQLTLHVVAPNAEGEVPAGAIRWSLSPTAVTSVPTALFIANSAATESVEVFGTETDTASGQNIIRALGADGEELWREASPVNWELGVQVGFADVFGGLVGIAQGTQSIPPSLLRVGGNDDIAPWRYVSPASFLGKPIQSLQGTIFLPEFTQHADGGQEAQLAAIDGSTGQFLFRLPIPSRVSVTRDDGTPNPPVVISGIPWPAVDAAGNAYVEYYNSDESQHYEGTTLVNVQKTSSVNLLIVRPDSTYSS